MSEQGISPRTLIVAAAALGVIAFFLLAGRRDAEPDPLPTDDAVAADSGTASDTGDEPDGTDDGSTETAPPEEDHEHGDDVGEELTAPPTVPVVTESPGVGPTPEVSVPSPTLPPGVERPGPADPPSADSVDGQNPVAVTEAALRTAYLMDAAVDASAQAAVDRARPWLAGDAAADGLSSLATEINAVWDSWQDHETYVEIYDVTEDTEDGAPEATPTSVYFGFSVLSTPLGRDGWTGNARTDFWFVELSRGSASEPWKVASMNRG